MSPHKILKKLLNQPIIHADFLSARLFIIIFTIKLNSFIRLSIGICVLSACVHLRYVETIPADTNVTGKTSSLSVR